MGVRMLGESELDDPLRCASGDGSGSTPCCVCTLQRFLEYSRFGLGVGVCRFPLQSYVRNVRTCLHYLSPARSLHTTQAKGSLPPLIFFIEKMLFGVFWVHKRKVADICAEEHETARVSQEEKRPSRRGPGRCHCVWKDRFAETRPDCHAIVHRVTHWRSCYLSCCK